MSSFTNIPAMRLLKNGQWETCESFFFYFDEPTDEIIEVPQGFKTDFASIPRIFWILIYPANPKWAKAAILHDFIYKQQPINPYTKEPFTQKEADSLFYQGCIILGTNKILAKIFYLSVRLFGCFYFDK